MTSCVSAVLSRAVLTMTSLSGSPAPSSVSGLLSPLLGTPNGGGVGAGAHSTSGSAQNARMPTPVARLALAGIDKGDKEAEAVEAHARTMGVAVEYCG